MIIRLLKWIFGVPDRVEPPFGGSQPSSTASRDYSTDHTDYSAPVESTPATPQSTSLSGLDTEKFAPLNVDDALQQTQSANWQTAYWDSLSVIPPADLASHQGHRRHNGRPGINQF